MFENNLKEFSFWAARLGLLFSFGLYMTGTQGPRDEHFTSAVITLLILAATFIPREYYSNIKNYVSIVFWNTGAILLLAFIFYASSTAALLFNQEALPGFGNLLGLTDVPYRWLTVIVFILIMPLIPGYTKPFRFLTTTRTKDPAQVSPTTRSTKGITVNPPVAKVPVVD
jgi:hypothetical protein